MVDLMLAGDEERIRGEGVIRTVCDPCCGSGEMLSIAKGHIQGSDVREGVNPDADFHLFGQEVNPETFSICKSDLYMKSADGRDANNIRFGTTLGDDVFTHNFNYQIANPPYGKDWKHLARPDRLLQGMGGKRPAGIRSPQDLSHRQHHHSQERSRRRPHKGPVVTSCREKDSRQRSRLSREGSS